MESDTPKRCGAKLRKKPGKFCRTRPMANGRCALHGGKQPIGPASPNWKTGRYSKWAAHFGARGSAIAEAAEDDELLNLRRTVAVCEIGVREAAKRLDQCDTPEWRKRAQELHKAAMDGGPTEMTALGEHLDQGAKEDRAFSVLLDRNEKLHKAVADTLDTMLRGANVLNLQQAQLLVRALFEIVKGETEALAFSRIVARFDGEVMGGRLALRGVLPRAVEST